MVRKCVMMVLLVLVASVASAQYPHWNLRIELDMMFMVKIGAEYRMSEDWGVQGSIGVPPLAPSTFSYSLYGVYHMREPDQSFQVDLYLGVPVAYVNLLEGRYVDWDPHIDDTYYGWLAAAGIKWSYDFGGLVAGLRTGYGAQLEYLGGVQNNFRPFPEFGLDLTFR
jgi:hypothetical protein